MPQILFALNLSFQNFMLQFKFLYYKNIQHANYNFIKFAKINIFINNIMNIGKYFYISTGLMIVFQVFLKLKNISLRIEL